MVQRKAIELFADYNQFYLWDSGMTAEAPVDYSEGDVQRRIKVGQHVVVIQPERNTTVNVEVEVLEADPGFDLALWDHIAEASLHLPTGQLQVHECTGGPVAEFAVSPGWYRIRSLGVGFATVTGIDGNDRYRTVLWPASPSEVRVVKQWMSFD